MSNVESRTRHPPSASEQRDRTILVARPGDEVRRAMGVALLQAYRLTGGERYLDAALANLDYILGRNATGFSFLTGYGSKTPRNIHHRPSAADGVTDPAPGLLAGGPNPGQQDRSSQCT